MNRQSKLIERSVVVLPQQAAVKQQRGVVLFIALIVLVAMSLAGIALVRSVDTNVLVAGNLAFRQGATAASDAPVEVARAWIVANAAGSGLYNDISSSAFFATWQSSFDPKTYAWEDATKAKPLTPLADAAGNQRYYVIHRMCSNSGDPNAASNLCVKSAASGRGRGSFGAIAYPGLALEEAGSPVYRITARVNGPKNTVTYVQTVIVP
jgi:type IV pilus assembly protein PilX